MGLGELGNFAAYGFAPASLIAPLGCVSVVGKTFSANNNEMTAELLALCQAHVPNITILLLLFQTAFVTFKLT